MENKKKEIEIYTFGNVSLPKKAEDLTLGELNALRGYLLFIDERIKELKINLVV